MKRCSSCNVPLAIVYFIMAPPFVERDKKYKDATNCIDLLSRKECEKMRKE